MDQTRAINALAPFIALAKSANSPRAAADLVTQATSAPNTYIFAELLQQPNVQALAGNEQYGSYLTLLQVFAWGTWETYQSTPNLPSLSSAQSTKLRLLSLLTIASSKTSSSDLSYSSLLTALSLPSPIDLEHLITQAIYNDLITGTLNPHSQTVVITSVSPLRDIAPGSIASMMSELEAWSGRCDSVLADLEAEIQKVKDEAAKRAKREQRAEKQIKAVMEGGEKSSGGSGGAGNVLSTSRTGHNTRAAKREQEDDDEDDDAMEIDSGSRAAGGSRKKSAGGSGGGGFMQRLRNAGGR